MSRFLFLTGFLLVAVGLALHCKVEIPFLTNWIGQLPGDLVIKKGNTTLYVPLATSLAFSIVLSLFFRSEK